MQAFIEYLFKINPVIKTSAGKKMNANNCREKTKTVAGGHLTVKNVVCRNYMLFVKIIFIMLK
jgi:hypothetical protein